MTDVAVDERRELCGEVKLEECCCDVELDLARAFKALGHPARLMILSKLGALAALLW